jgi:hypothetical protein
MRFLSAEEEGAGEEDGQGVRRLHQRDAADDIADGQRGGAEAEVRS